MEARFCQLGPPGLLTIYLGTHPSTVCRIRFVTPIMALSGFPSRVKNLPSEIVVQYSEVSLLCLGAHCCAITMMLLTTTSPAIVRPHVTDVQESSRTQMKFSHSDERSGRAACQTGRQLQDKPRADNAPTTKRGVSPKLFRK